jgi:hypothetical protein
MPTDRRYTGQQLETPGGAFNNNNYHGACPEPAERDARMYNAGSIRSRHY